MPSVTEPEIPYRAEVIRKVLHLMSLVIPAGLLVVGRELGLMVLAPAAVLAVSADVLRVRSAWFARFILRIFGWMMRRHELPPLGGPVRINGATWVLINGALLTLVFPLHIAVVSFATVQVADAAAALVGRRFGRRKWGQSSKTLEGSLAFLMAGLAIVAAQDLIPLVPFWPGVVALVIATVLEVPELPLNDNIVVPFSMATVLFLFEHFFLGSRFAFFG